MKRALGKAKLLDWSERRASDRHGPLARGCDGPAPWAYFGIRWQAERSNPS